MPANPEPAAIDLLIVDDDAELRGNLVRFFQKQGYRVEQAGDGEEALGLADKRVFDVAVADLVMPGISGIEFLEKLKADGGDTEIVLLTGEATIESAVESMKLGAHDYLTKPVRLKELEAVVRKAFEAGRLRKENRHLRAVIQRQQRPHQMIGQSKIMQDVFRLIDRAGRTDKPILVQGESGTGKELVASALHQASPLSEKPLVVINCAALPDTLLESELFGHEKGAFTGATTTKPGLFEVADGGTLFIDEIGELPPALQPKLLRVLEDGSMRRIGSLKERRVHVRILAASNRDMELEVKEHRFREDLYYRINVLTIKLPPLRQHPEDIPLLIDHFVGPDWEIEQAAIDGLSRYHWPGNVRQLINAVERAKIMSDDYVIRLENLDPEITSGPAESSQEFHETGEDLSSIQRAHILEILTRERGNKARAAQSLGISRRSLYRLIEKYEIDVSKLNV